MPKEKPELSDAMRDKMSRKLPEKKPIIGTRFTIAISSAKGGVGTSFITVNLAAELAPVHRVCAVDLDFSMGDLASMLDLQTTTSMQDLLAMVR